MAAAGILLPDERVELIRGEILQMSPIGTRHGAAVDRGTRVLGRLAGDAAILRIQGTVELDKLCAPQPERVSFIAATRSRLNFFRTAGSTRAR